jgi:hypothetical protein
MMRTTRRPATSKWTLLPALLLALARCAGAEQPWAAEADAQANADGMAEFFKDARVRAVGSPGNQAIEAKVAAQFAASGFENGAIRFDAPAFIPGKTLLSAPEFGEITLHPMHPSIIRPGNFKERDFNTRLVYLGRATTDDLAAVKGIDLDGALAVLEFNCGDDWARLLRFGVKGFIFIGAEQYEPMDAAQKIHGSNVNVPRFFASAEDGVKLRAGVIKEAGGRVALAARAQAEPSVWKNVEVRDLWALVPGKNPALGREVCVLTAPLDSNGVVPHLAEGGQNGANLWLLMQLLEEFKKSPPDRSLLLVAVNAHTQFYAGERQLAWNLLAPKSDVEEFRSLLAADIRLQEMYRRHYQALTDLLSDPAKQDAAEKLLIELRHMTDGATGKLLPVKGPLVARIQRDINQGKSMQMEAFNALRDGGAAEDEAGEKTRHFGASRADLIGVLKLFNKWRGKTLGELDGAQRELLKNYVKSELARNTRFAELNTRDLKRDEANSSISAALKGGSVRWVMALDLNTRRREIGICSGEFWRNQSWRLAYAKKLMEVAGQMAGAREGKARLLADTMTFKGGMPEGHYFTISALTALFQSLGQTPAFSLQNVYAFNGDLFTPGDTFARLQKDNHAELARYIPALLRDVLAADATMLHGKKDIQPGWSIRLRMLKFDEFSAAVVPEIEVGNTFVTIRGNALPVMGDVIQNYMALTDERGVAAFNVLSSPWTLSSAAFKFDKDFTEVEECIDAGEREKSLTSNIDKTLTQTIVMFPCKEFPVYAREDSSLVSASSIGIQKVKPLDARRESPPRQFGLSGFSSSASDKKFFDLPGGPASVFLPKKTGLKLLSDRLAALNSTPEKPEGLGFASAAELGPDLIRRAARDMMLLNKFRLGQFRGISQELAVKFQAESEKALAVMDEAMSQNDHIGYLQALHTALGAARQAYAQVSGITNDMLRAVVFYMALILPFCFFMQKLLFNFVKIESQIAAFFFLFLACYLSFRQIHPAFEIAKSPEGILIAFVMGGLGAFVIKILHGRFEGEMQMLFRNFAGEGGEIGASTVGQKAMLIGVNNMRRRRVRTALTTATIVLVTFTMLSFTSISSTMSPTVRPKKDTAPPYTGIMFHWPGCMDEASLDVFREMFHGKGDLVERRWLLPPQLEKSVLPFHIDIGGAKSAQIEGVLGLSLKEDGFLAPIPLTAGKYFSSDDASEVIVPASVADSLGINSDNIGKATLRFQGCDLTVVGVLHEERFRAITDLDNLQLLPQKEGAPAGDPGGDTPQSGEQTGLYVDSSMILILPLNKAGKLGAQPYSISVRLPESNANLWREVMSLLTMTEAKFYIGSRSPFTAGLPEEVRNENGTLETKTSGQQLQPGSYYIGAGFRNSYGNLASLLIPLLISGTIILNTMLGSVFERKKEIAIYNAVGLNPNHIGMFFLSEAFVYGIVGSVGGYMIGQGMAILLKSLNVGGINLNFSSLMVVYVIMFTIGMVLVSTLYPAIVATRAAVPSGKRKWSFPEHDGHRMQIVFPFIYQPGVVCGIIGYLEEYFARFTEASVGDLIARRTAKIRGVDAAGRETYTLAYDVALAPFDLGVTQRVTFFAAYDSHVRSYRLTLTSVRNSGQDTNWVTTNKPFLERLRAYLMYWRNLEPAQQAAYAQAAGTFSVEDAPAALAAASAD